MNREAILSNTQGGLRVKTSCLDFSSLAFNFPSWPIPSIPTTFTLFPELPQSLRNKIWCHVTKEPRVVHLGCFSDSTVDQLEAAVIVHAPAKYDRKERYHTKCPGSRFVLSGEARFDWSIWSILFLICTVNKELVECYRLDIIINTPQTKEVSVWKDILLKAGLSRND
jgi:hypothetical protein